MFTSRVSFAFTTFAGLVFATVAWCQGGPSDFWKRFVAEADNNDPKAMAKLVQREPDNAVWCLSDAANSFFVNNSPELSDRIEKLITAWKDSQKTNFLDKYYEDLRNFDQSQWNEWRRSLGRYNALLAADQKRKKGELDNDGVAKFVADSLEVAGIFEAQGDKYLASACYFWAGVALDPDNNTKTPDGVRALDYYKKTLKFREDLDHKDSWYTDLSSRCERLVLENKKGPAEKKPEKKDPKAPGKGGTELGGGEFFAKDSKWVPSPGKFVLTGLTEFEKPGWNCDEYLLDWTAAGIQGKPDVKPAEGKIPFFEASKEAKFVREADAKFALDPGTKALVPLKLGKPTPVEFKLPNGGEYALTAAMGSNQEPIQGTAINVAGRADYCEIFFTTAASRTVEIMGQKLRIFDDNCDGRMGSDPIELKDFRERMEGNLPLIDSMTIGAGKRAVPFSGFVKLGPKWYRVKSDSEGTGAKFQARELDIKTGTVKLVWNGPAAYKPKYMVIREVGDYTGAYFDLIGADKGLEVPAGEYEFYFGMFRSGKGKQVQKYLVSPGADAKKIAVAPGTLTTITMGAPFTFVYKSTQDGSDVSITGKSVGIIGSGGERYVMLSDETPRPKVEVKKPGAKTGTEIGEMKRAELTSKTTPGVLFFPADFKAKKPDGSAVEIRLVEDHKWFGTIASGWNP